MTTHPKVVPLGDVVGEHDPRVLADPREHRQENAALERLRFIDDDERVVQAATTDVSKRQHLEHVPVDDLIDHVIGYQGAEGVEHGLRPLESIRLIANCSRLLADRCIDDTTADVDRCKAYAESSPSIVTPLNRYIGYENGAKAAKKALADGTTVRQAVIDLGLMGDGEGQVTEAQLDEALDVLAMAYPHGR